MPVVAAIVERAGKVVLVRSLGRPPTWFGLVAGFLESGETPEQAVLREVVEELGIEALRGAFVGSYPFERLNQIIFVYHVLGGAGPIRAGGGRARGLPRNTDREDQTVAARHGARACATGSRRAASTRQIADFGTPQDE